MPDQEWVVPIRRPRLLEASICLLGSPTERHEKHLSELIGLVLLVVISSLYKSLTKIPHPHHD